MNGRIEPTGIGQPETNPMLASARQIHVAMNLHAAGEQESAITLAAATEGNASRTG